MIKLRRTANEQDDNGAPLLSQEELDNMLHISSLISPAQEAQNSLIDEIKRALLDSVKLQLGEWKSLRKRLHEIEELIPHIDLIISLKEEDIRRKHLPGIKPSTR